MKWLDALRGKEAKAAHVDTSTARVVHIDNTTTDDNWLVNETDMPVTVACGDMGGTFSVDLLPKQRKRITSDVRAAPFPPDIDSYGPLRYSIARGEEWAVRREHGELILVKRR